MLNYPDMRNWPTSVAAATVAACAALCGIATVSHAQAPPLNDHYLQSLRLNEPGKALERKDSLRDARDTRNASVQADLFNPPQSGGPTEPTQCDGANYGRTVWYDFYPDVTGLVRLRASGYDTVLSVIPFDRRSGRPDIGRRLCSNASASTTEEYLARVRRGGSYTVQIGGVNNFGGNLEFLFDFLADTDADGVLDDVDKCDRLKGTARNSGCPVRLRGTATIRAKPTATGIQLLGLTVTATRGSRVEVRCNRGCRRQVKRARRRVSFRGLRGRNFRAGTKLEVRVTRRNSIGAYVRFTITRGNFKRTERCLNPGSRRPRRRCG